MAAERSKKKIGTLKERSLHASLKTWLERPGDVFEVEIEGFLIDIVREEKDLLIEIQTKNFFALKRKLAILLENHQVRLVHPITSEKWLVKYDDSGEKVLERRKSPMRGKISDVFEELVSIPELFKNSNLTLQLLMIHEEEHRRDDGEGSRHRNGWSIKDRKLIEVSRSHLFSGPLAFRDFLPKGLPSEFTTTDIADASGEPRWVSQKVAYCLKKMGAIRQIGKRGRSYLYSQDKSSVA
ncbi:MAG: hypothetical protein JKX97_07110 [Candidatus Lindowbacteria bacterium]|nr:hypothetical protein [Candidatus Lindowbacteria bacterium]